VTLSQEWMEMHALPNDVQQTGLLPATSYVVVPKQDALARKGISNTEAMAMEAAFLVTNEMMQSLSQYLLALKTAGFEQNKIGLDIDGKHKLVRTGWELITFGCRWDL
jgi:hypothetical protein